MLLEELVSIRWGFNLLCDNRKIRFDSDPFGSIFFRHFGYCSGTALNVADHKGSNYILDSFPPFLNNMVAGFRYSPPS